MRSIIRKIIYENFQNWYRYQSNKDIISCLVADRYYTDNEFKKYFIKNLTKIKDNLYDIYFIDGFSVKASYSDKYQKWYFFRGNDKIDYIDLQFHISSIRSKYLNQINLNKIIQQLNPLVLDKYVKEINKIDDNNFNIVFTNNYIVKANIEDGNWTFEYKGQKLNIEQFKEVLSKPFEKDKIFKSLKNKISNIFGISFEEFLKSKNIRIVERTIYKYDFILENKISVNFDYNTDNDNWSISVLNHEITYDELKLLLSNPTEKLENLLKDFDFYYLKTDDPKIRRQWQPKYNEILSLINLMIKFGYENNAKKIWDKYSKGAQVFPTTEIVNEAIGDFKNKKKYFVPLKVSNNAKEALIKFKDTKFEHDSDHGSGKQKAQELADKIPQNHTQMKRLLAFFEKFSDNKNEAWELHGGDECYDWVKREIKNTKQSNLNTKKNLRLMGGAGTNKGLGTLDTRMMDTTRKRIYK